MLRLNVYCSLIPSPRHIKLGCGCGSWIVRYQGAEKPFGRVSVRALKDETDGGGTRSSPGQSWDPGLEIEVPFEQRPVNEYSSLKDGPLYSWGDLEPGELFLRLGGLWLVTFTVLGVPVAAASFNPSKEPLRFVLAASTGTLLIVSLIVLRIYLGWSYVGDRLLSAVIPYEESGWYDGQMWVKPPEVLARDRLLGSYKVKPVVQLLKQTLVGTGALLVTGVLLFIFATPVQDFFQTTFAKSKNRPNVVASEISTKYNVRKEELLSLPVEVISDDDLAAAAATAAEGRPVYINIFREKYSLEYCLSWPCMVWKQRDTSMISMSDVSRFTLQCPHNRECNHTYSINKCDLKDQNILADQQNNRALRCSPQSSPVQKFQQLVFPPSRAFQQSHPPRVE